MKKMKKLGVIFAFIAPAILGFIGYLFDGNNAMDSAYGAVQMYLMEAGGTNNNALIEVGRWVAPVMTVSGLFLILKTAMARLKDFFVGFCSDAVALYGDAPTKEIAKKNIRHTVCVEDGDIMDAQTHMLMFATDERALEFYTKNKDKLHGEVFMQLEKNDSYSVELDRIKFFNPSEMIARKFWQTYDIRRVLAQNEMKIAIVGSDTLSKKILSFGLLNNIYSLTQKIEYHVFSEDDFFRKAHGDFDTANADGIVYHDLRSADSLLDLGVMDRIIITEKPDNAFLSELSQISGGEIFVFDPMGTFVNIFGCDRIVAFGRYDEVITQENLRMDKFKVLNHEYALKYSWSGKAVLSVDGEWEKLDNFTKGSNIAATDYCAVLKVVMQETGKSEVDDTLAELEHIRWCRYHYLHHWKYGETSNGRKDTANKIHPCLKPYAQLSDIDRQKDADGLRTLLALATRGEL